CQQGKTLPWTF
nr:immunoglobulin light chain junction region [Mus musculus]NSL97638.1 immunoglobulin light chain junction region [Mus musculus]NSL97728.1 immunoglobulin light chain junction region [Mus musculus]NSL98307.1 immunoglobulin light chain junction region [Mus musculus]NSL98308.1 immunoglobulin light chain junction region [Mus musculus]